MRSGIRDQGSGIRVIVLFAAILVSQVALAAQHEHMAPAQPNRAQGKVAPIPDPRSPIPDLGWEPIRCWRQASAGAVTIGERFTVVVTCAVYEADNAQVIPDESRLNVASIQMAPFEILGGSHPPDVRRGSRRFFQYDYQLRIIGPDAIGRDLNIPPLSISYRIQSRVGAAATLEGRDLSYVLPMLPIKVLSMVPNDAADIRDASEASLAAVDTLRFRSSLFWVLTMVFGALAAVMAVLGLVPLARSTSVQNRAERERIPDYAVLNRVADDLGELRKNVAAGWTDEAVARALSLTRITAAAAIGQPISQKVGVAGAAPEGRIPVQYGLIKTTRATISSSVTADDVARAMTGREFSTARRQQLEGLQSAIAAFSNALYRQQPVRDASTLDDAVRLTIGVAREVARERNWIRTLWARR
jgi:hypothetical protein